VQPGWTLGEREGGKEREREREGGEREREREERERGMHVQAGK
jgi:hypothetical protein